MLRWKRTWSVMVVAGSLMFGGMSCQMFEGLQNNPTMPGGNSVTLSNYTQMADGALVMDGQQLNMVVNEWGALPYGNWMYLEINQQEGPGKQPGDGQIPVTLGNVGLNFSGLASDITAIVIGVKAMHNDNDQTFTERGRFAVVDGSVSISLDYGDLTAFFGITHYAIWFQALGGANGAGLTTAQITITGTMPGGQSVTFSKPVSFGTIPASPACPQRRHVDL
jgi:hypothetical protein